MRAILGITLLLGLVAAASAQEVTAPNLRVNTIDQRDVLANGCGPVTLYHSLAFGSAKWNELLPVIANGPAKQKIRTIARTYGNRPSTFIRGTKRWDNARGIRAEDLAHILSEIIGGRMLPKPRVESHLHTPSETNVELLAKAHARFKRSLQRGFPPMLSIQRYAEKRGLWMQHQGHFVSVIGLPESLPANATSFRITYVDPWGGRVLIGHIRAPKAKYPPQPKGGALFDIRTGPVGLLADFPRTSVGRDTLAKGQRHKLILSRSIAVK